MLTHDEIKQYDLIKLKSGEEVVVLEKKPNAQYEFTYYIEIELPDGTLDVSAVVLSEIEKVVKLANKKTA